MAAGRQPPEGMVQVLFGRLASRGHRVTLLVSGFEGCAPRTELDGMEVHRTGRRYTFSLAAPRYFRHQLAGGAFDVVVEDLNKVPLFSPYWVDAPVALLVHHLFGATAFREANWALATATWLLERPVPLVYRGTPVVAVSESTREDLLARGLPGPIEVIPNGVDLDAFRPASPAERTPDPTLLYLGRIKRYKRVDLILRAVALLRDRGLHVRFRVAGSGDARTALERLARSLGIQDRVEFLGFVDDATKHELFRTSWLHVLTSAKEGWGISNVEAAACGTPTVASDAPGLRESVRHGETGLLVPHGDVEALADAIQQVVTDPAILERLGEGARRFAEGFSWDRSALAMERFLESAVAHRAPEAPISLFPPHRKDDR